MQKETVCLVRRQDVITSECRMQDHLRDANIVSINSTYKALSDATRALHIATGFYRVLDGLGLLEEKQMVKEDIERIEQKIVGILEEKRRTHVPWKGGRI